MSIMIASSQDEHNEEIVPAKVLFIIKPVGRVYTMNTFSHVPPGFRFHPTDEELVDYYLRKKVASKRIDLDVIKDVDLYKIEPWDLQELCKIGSEDQNEWYFFSHKDKKYPTGTRTNRATKAGFWKATGRDKAIYVKQSLVGMRKTLVFYKGRAPNGQKSDWIMHEYRLETNENGAPQEEGWVVCRVFKKRMTTVQKVADYESPCWYDDRASFMADQLDSPRRMISHHPATLITPYHHHHHHFAACKKELEFHYNTTNIMHVDPFFQLPQLESPKVPCSGYDHSSTAMQSPTLTQDDQQVQQALQCNNNNNNNNSNNNQQNLNSLFGITNNNNNNNNEQVTDWRVLDKFVASQLSHVDHDDQDSTVAPKEITNNYSVNEAVFHVVEHMNLLASDQSIKRPEIAQDYASSSTSVSCQIDLWK